MTAETIIAEIQKLPREEVAKVVDFLSVPDFEAELEADRISLARAQEMEDGTVSALTEEEVFNRARAKIS